MKKVVFLFVFSFVTLGYTQDVITKKVGDFSELKVFDKIELQLVKGTENKVEISGIERKNVDIILKGEVLKVKMSLDNLWDNNNTIVRVFYTDVFKIDANEGSKVEVKDIFASEDLDLRAQEGAEIHATIETDELVVRAVTGGEINVKGTAKIQDATIKAGGQYFAEDLKTENTIVKISAGGRASVNASKYVKANTNAGGTVRIYGNPKEIDSKKVFGGKIIEVN